MSSFKEFLSTFSSKSDEKGKQFERFVKWFLVNDPTWKTQVEQVWHWDEYPSRWGKDLGIDLVFQHKNGDHWAVQAKCYAETTSITKAHVDSFISESDSKTFSGRLLIGTTDSLADNAKKVCDRQNVTRFLLADFESSAFEFPDHYEELLRAEPPKPPEPREHQLEAIKAVREGFKDTDRGQLIMACGTGKTFTTLWVKEALDAESTLILLPSLGLLSQTLHEWTKAASKPFEVLCVCSDDSVGKKGDDESYESVAQLPFPVTSDPQRIQAFLELQKPKVVFSTYQSSPLVAEAQAADTGIEFDLIVADEAHRCAGVVGDGFSSVLNGERLRGKKRLFATATPRTYSKQIKSAAEGRGIEVVGMDDEAVFGRPLYTLSFGEAIERKLLTDYRVVIVGVDDAMLASWIENREIVRTDTGIQTDAKSLAATVGLLKAIKDYDLHRVISFHSRVNGAEAFAEEIHEVQKWLPQEVRLAGKLNSDYVSGAMPTDKRRQKLSHLKNVKGGEVALLSNARCLSEGVDVPSLDGIAFIDPKNSQIDIIQAVGRAIRLSTNKTAGTIVLPVFIEKGNTAEEVIERSDFKQIWGVMAALKAHDETFANELTQLRTELGRKGKSFKLEGLDKVVFDLPMTVEASLSSALRAELVISTTASWDEWFGRLVVYAQEHGDVRVPTEYKTPDGMSLGTWIRTQRANQGELSAEQRSRLETLIGWSWDPLEDQWDLNYQALISYVGQHGNSNVPFATNLGRWVAHQRVVRGKLSDSRIARLEAIDCWVWEPRDFKWTLLFNALKLFANDHGHCLPSRKDLAPDGSSLGTWVQNQRKNRSSLSLSKVDKLEALNGWSWDPLEDQWKSMFDALRSYLDQHGDSNVPYRYKTSDGIPLGQWVKTQRSFKKKLSHDKKTKLEALTGWCWDPQQDLWDEGFSALKSHVELHGSAFVSKTRGIYTSRGVSLATWIVRQRVKREQLSADQRAKLERLSGWSWDPLEDQWNLNYQALLRYADEHGSTLVPPSYKTGDGISLGQWIISQRQKRASLSVHRVDKLEALQGWSWDPLEDQWNLNYEALLRYVDEHGTSLVPNSYKSLDGISLGQWVRAQRKSKDSMPADRKERLEALEGWVWKVRNV